MSRPVPPGRWPGSVRELTGRGSSYPETNALDPAARPRWFRAVAEWLAGNGGDRMLTFWKKGGSSGGPWLPDDADTIRALNELGAVHG